MSKLSQLEQHPTDKRRMGGVGQGMAAGAVELSWIAVTTGVLTAAVLAWLRPTLVAAGMVDVPDERRLHAQVTPRGGGLGMALVMSGVLLVALWWASVSVAAASSVLMLTIGIAALGGLEDHLGLGVMVRLLAQALLATVSLALVIGTLMPEAMGPFAALFLLVLVPAMVWSINLHNFMDGSDGLAGLQGVWVGLGMAVLFHGQGDAAAALVAVTLAGACAGLLVWNWPPARLFMGDSGSLLIGALVAWLIIWGHVQGTLPWWLGLMWVSVFLVDTTATLLLRLWRGERWYTAHCSHAYQILIAMGVTHGQVLIGFIVLKLGLVLPAVISVYSGQVDPRLAMVGVYALLALGWVGAQYRGWKRVR